MAPTTVHDEMYIDYLRRLNELNHLEDDIHVMSEGFVEDRNHVVHALELACSVADSAAEIYRLYKDTAALEAAARHTELVETLTMILVANDQAQGIIGREWN